MKIIKIDCWGWWYSYEFKLWGQGGGICGLQYITNVCLLLWSSSELNFWGGEGGSKGGPHETFNGKVLIINLILV